MTHPSGCECIDCLKAKLAFAQHQAAHFEREALRYHRRLIAVTGVQRSMRSLADQLAAIESGRDDAA